jgi:adenylosuccinate synthase
MALERMLLLSGAMGAGKTAVGVLLSSADRFCKLSTSGYLKSYGATLGADGERMALQDLGDRLDVETDYRWVIDDVTVPALAAAPDVDRWLLDAARKPRQVEHFRNAFGSSVRHVHLTAPEPVLIERYTTRMMPGDTPYEVAVLHPNEVAARSLEHHADIVVDTSWWSPEQVVLRISTMWEA